MAALVTLTVIVPLLAAVVCALLGAHDAWQRRKRRHELMRVLRREYARLTGVEEADDDIARLVGDRQIPHARVAWRPQPGPR